MDKRTMTLNLTEREMRALDELCKKKGLNKTAIMRQALGLYQAVDIRLEQGERLILEDAKTNKKSELMVL